MISTLLFLLGLSVGSFLNVVIDRIPAGRSLGGRSHCESCQHQLGLIDLIPIVSFFLLKGRCRYCREKLSLQYPLIELATGIIFVISVPLLLKQINTDLLNDINYLAGDYQPVIIGLTVLCLFLVTFLIALFAIDLKYGVVPDIIVWPAIILSFTYQLSVTGFRIWSLYIKLKNDTDGLGPYLLRTEYFRNHALLEVKALLLTVVGGLIIAAFFYLLIVMTKGRGMGFGDVLLGLLIGLIAGFPRVIPAAFFSFLTGAIVSLILILMQRKHFGQTIPFGPFLILGLVLSFFYGDIFLANYLGLF